MTTQTIPHGLVVDALARATADFAGEHPDEAEVEAYKSGVADTLFVLLGENGAVGYFAAVEREPSADDAPAPAG